MADSAVARLRGILARDMTANAIDQLLTDVRADDLDLIRRISEERDGLRQLHHEAEQAVTRLMAEVEQLEEALDVR